MKYKSAFPLMVLSTLICDSEYICIICIRVHNEDVPAALEVREQSRGLDLCVQLLVSTETNDVVDQPTAINSYLQSSIARYKPL